MVPRDLSAGRGSEKKVPFVIAVSTTEDNKPQMVVASRVSGFIPRGARMRCLQRRLEVLRCSRRDGSRSQRAHCQAPRSGRGSGDAMGKHGSQQHQAQHRRQLPCVSLRKVRPTLPDRGHVAVRSAPESCHPGTLTHCRCREPHGMDRMKSGQQNQGLLKDDANQVRQRV